MSTTGSTRSGRRTLAGCSAPLVASARDEADRTSLRWLEAQPPPVIRAARDAGEGRRTSYVVVNSLSDKGGNLTHPGRTNNLWSRTRAFPSRSRVEMEWPGEIDPRVAESVDGMAKRVPYLGRSTSVVLMSAAAADGISPETDGDADLAVYEPCDLLGQDLSLRIPYAGFLDDLDDQYALDRPAWEVCRRHGYRRVRAGENPEDPAGTDVVASSFPDLLVFRFTGVKPQPDLAPAFTKAFQQAVFKTAGRDAPSVLHGHGADGRPHVAFLALPDVGSQYSDGHLLGLGVAIPELPTGQRAEVLRAVLGWCRSDGSEAMELRVPGIGEVQLVYRPTETKPWGATPDRWRQASTRWVTATPVVLDRFPDSQDADDVEHVVRISLRTVGLPDPIDVETSRQPLLPGAVRLRPADLPRRARGRLFRHVAVTFDRPVAGPVLVGAGRYLGVGLLAPVRVRRNHA